MNLQSSKFFSILIFLSFLSSLNLWSMNPKRYNNREKEWSAIGNSLVSPKKESPLDTLVTILKEKDIEYYYIHVIKELKIPDSDIELLVGEMKTLERSEAQSHFQTFLKGKQNPFPGTTTTEEDVPQAAKVFTIDNLRDALKKRVIPIHPIKGIETLDISQEELGSLISKVESAATKQEIKDFIANFMEVKRELAQKAAAERAKRKAEEEVDDEPLPKRIKPNPADEDLCLTETKFCELGITKNIAANSMKAFFKATPDAELASAYAIINMSDDQMALNFVKSVIGADAAQPIHNATTKALGIIPFTEQHLRENGFSELDIEYSLKLVEDLLNKGITEAKIHEFNNLIVLYAAQMPGEPNISVEDAAQICSLLCELGASQSCFRDLRMKLETERTKVIESTIREIKNNSVGGVVDRILERDFDSDDNGLNKDNAGTNLSMVVDALKKMQEPELDRESIEADFIDLAKKKNISRDLMNSFLYVLDANDALNQRTVIDLFDDDAEALNHITNTVKNSKESAMSERLLLAAASFMDEDFEVEDNLTCVELMTDLFHTASVDLQKIDLFVEIILAYASLISRYPKAIPLNDAALFFSSFVKNAPNTNVVAKFLDDLKQHPTGIVILMATYITQNGNNAETAAKSMLDSLAAIKNRPNL